MTFQVTILGCGSALPAHGKHPSGQVVNIGERLHLVDCGEGTQDRLRLNHVRMQRIGHIFITHLHGDHYLGLMGFLSSLNLLGREKEMTIICPPGLQEIIEVQLRHSKSKLRYGLNFVETTIDGVVRVHETDRLIVESVPLRHRIHVTGFVFREKHALPNMSKAAIMRYGIGVKEIHQIKQGGDLTLEDGRLIPHSELTIAAPPPRSYAYMSDTAYHPDIVPAIKGVDLLYHEATFEDKDLDKAVKTRHSTASQAAMIAKEAEVGSLLIGHFSARYDAENALLSEAKKVFKNTKEAVEGASYEVGA